MSFSFSEVAAGWCACVGGEAGAEKPNPKGAREAFFHPSLNKSNHTYGLCAD